MKTSTGRLTCLFDNVMTTAGAISNLVCRGVPTSVETKGNDTTCSPVHDFERNG